MTDITIAWLVHLYVRVHVRLSHSLPAKAVGWNEMPFGRETCVVTSNIVLDRAPVKICIANSSQTINHSSLVTVDSI